MCGDEMCREDVMWRMGCAGKEMYRGRDVWERGCVRGGDVGEEICVWESNA